MISSVSKFYGDECPFQTDGVITEKWTGSTDRDSDFRDGMLTTLARIKQAAEAGQDQQVGCAR